MRYISLFLILISIYSCSTPEKKLQKLIKKHPELIVRDTFHLKDTFYIEKHSIDTTFIHTVSHDTVTIEDSVMVIKYVNNGKTVYLKGECKDREVIVEKKVPFDRIRDVIVEVKPWYVKYLWWWLILSVGVIAGRFGWNVVMKRLSL